MAEFDQHKYSDNVLKCFIEATKEEDFVEAVSKCQYAMHGVEFLGESSAQEL